MTQRLKPASIQGAMAGDAKIYTKTGDTGQTSLGDNRRVPKWDRRIEALGALDELNSQLGLALSMLPPRSQIRAILPTIQHLLLTVGSHVALPPDTQATYRTRVPQLPAGAAEALEATIDQWWAHLPPLRTFILPGGTPAAAALHVARTSARRAERYISALPTLSDSAILGWLNRLSDFLFTAARFSNFEQHVPDVIWEKELEIGQ